MKNFTRRLKDVVDILKNNSLIAYAGLALTALICLIGGCFKYDVLTNAIFIIGTINACWVLFKAKTFWRYVGVGLWQLLLLAYLLMLLWDILAIPFWMCFVFVYWVLALAIPQNTQCQKYTEKDISKYTSSKSSDKSKCRFVYEKDDGSRFAYEGSSEKFDELFKNFNSSSSKASSTSSNTPSEEIHTWKFARIPLLRIPNLLVRYQLDICTSQKTITKITLIRGNKVQLSNVYDDDDNGDLKYLLGCSTLVVKVFIPRPRNPFQAPPKKEESTIEIWRGVPNEIRRLAGNEIDRINAVKCK